MGEVLALELPESARSSCLDASSLPSPPIPAPAPLPAPGLPHFASRRGSSGAPPHSHPATPLAWIPSKSAARAPGSAGVRAEDARGAGPSGGPGAHLPPPSRCPARRPRSRARPRSPLAPPAHPPPRRRPPPPPAEASPAPGSSRPRPAVPGATGVSGGGRQTSRPAARNLFLNWGFVPRFAGGGGDRASPAAVGVQVWVPPFPARPEPPCPARPPAGGGVSQSAAVPPQRRERETA